MPFYGIFFCVVKKKKSYNQTNCQALSISQSLNLSLSLRDRDRADTIITLYHTTPHHHQHLFIGDLYSSVIHHWNRQLKPYSFPLRKNRVNYGHLLPSLSALGLINILSDLHSSVIVTYTLLILKCDTSLESSAQALLISTQKE